METQEKTKCGQLENITAVGGTRADPGGLKLPWHWDKQMANLIANANSAPPTHDTLDVMLRNLDFIPYNVGTKATWSVISSHPGEPK